jgi:hypothetical protein
MDTLEEIVADYIQCHRRNAEKEQRWFAIQPTLEDAISFAALARSPSGKRLSHQCRIPESALTESRQRLLSLEASLSQASSFENLLEIVSLAIKPIPGIGDLTVYDTALRIGAKLGLEPSVVFLHAGTREGARILCLDVSCGYVELSKLPPDFQKLKPREVEDILCMYKACFCNL